MRLHRKLTSPRLGAMFSPPLSSIELVNLESTHEPGQGGCRLGLYGLGRPMQPRRSSRQRPRGSARGLFFVLAERADVRWFFS